jgi:uncharacterized membrane protein
MTEFLTHVLFYSHLLGFAAVAGGLLAQLTAKTHRITGVILNGARWQIISGLTLVGIAPKDYNMIPVAIKLGIVLIILAFCEALRKKPSISNKVYWLLLILVIVQTAVALTVAKEAVAPVVVS